MRRTLLTLVVVLFAAASLPAGANPVTHDSCPGVSATTSVWKSTGDVLENLGFDGLGNVWIANSTKGRVEKYDADGTLQGFFSLAAPGALTPGPDGLMYANFGDAIVGSILQTGQAGVVRFDPAKPITATEPFASVYASGLDMANGGIFDAAGNYYASNDVGVELTKITALQTIDAAWTRQADVWGTNGLVVKGSFLYAAITFDQRSSIVRIPLAEPSAHSILKQTTVGVVTLQPAVSASPDLTSPLVGLKGLDDMTLGPDGNLYVVANGMGELLRVSLETGDTCLVAGGFRSPSSVRFARSFGTFSDTADLLVTEFSGEIRRVTLPAS